MFSIIVIILIQCDVSCAFIAFIVVSSLVRNALLVVKARRRYLEAIIDIEFLGSTLIYRPYFLTPSSLVKVSNFLHPSLGLLGNQRSDTTVG